MKKLTIYIHGECKEDLGPAAIGVYIVNARGDIELSLAESIGNGTNEYAEYFAVVRALQELKEKFGDDTNNMEFELKSSSELVINNLCAKEQIKDVSLIGHFIEIFNIRVTNFPNLYPMLVEQGLNKKAIGLAKANLDA
jgi:ribonuclease HI